MQGRISVFISLLLLFLSLPLAAETVNINQADTAAIQEYLTGIGPVKAKAIVSYRSKNGSFKSLDDLTQVPGIGEELLRKNRKSLSLNSGVTKIDVKAVKKSVDKKSSSSSALDNKTKKAKKAEKKS